LILGLGARKWSASEKRPLPDSSVTDFKKLKVWQRAHLMAMDAHRVSGQIRGTKYSSLRSQINRAALSVPTNIVEGCGQQSPLEFSRFLRIALNSTSELEYHLLAARELAAVRAADALTLTTQVIEVRKMLYGLLRYLASRAEDETSAPAATSEL
jgi:four helix bundle protein